MKLFNSTTKWTNWWAKRKIVWKDHYGNPQHPHRLLIAETIKHLPNWGCVIELGCGAGANLYILIKSMPGRPIQVGGVDINPDAIAECEKNFVGGLFKVNNADDTLFSDKMSDIILTDMYMIYVSPRKITKQLNEIKRLGRNYVVMCEFHSSKWWDRLAVKWKEGYNVYDYHKLLEKHGFYNINIYKVPKDFWPESDLQQKYAHIIVARIPNEY